MKNGKVFLRLSVIALLLACTSGTIVQAEDVSGKVNEVSESAEDTVYGGNAADGSGMIQQERQNNIINILGGHSYAM